MNRALHLLLVPLALSSILLGCSSGGGFSQRTAEGTESTFRYAMPVVPTTLDPGNVQDIDTSDLLQNVYEGLVAYDESNKIVGRLAESFSVENDGKTYVFKLRENAKFHSGRPLTADDVKWSFERNLHPSFSSPTALNYLDDIVGAKEFADGKAEGIRGIEVRGPSEVAITIDSPRPYFIGKLTYPVAFILAKESATAKLVTSVAASNGTGPFKVKEYAPDQEVVLEANADYYLGAPKVSRIERPIIADAATRLGKFRAGELDMLLIQRGEVKAVEGDKELSGQLTWQPRPSVTYIGLSQHNYAPLRNPKVRRALSMAIDRDRIVGPLLGNVPKGTTLIPHNVPGYREGHLVLRYDPAAARKELAEAGYPNGKGLPPLQLTFRAQTPDSQVIAEAVATSVRQNLNWEIRPQALEWSAMLDRRNKRQLDSYILAWYGDYLDPQNFLSFLFHSKSPQNREAYANAEFDRISEQADKELDETKRMELYQKAEDILLADGARIPILYGRDPVLIAPRIKGVRYNLFGNLPHSSVEIGK